MIKCETTIGREEFEIIAEISLKYANNKRKRIFGTVLLFAAAGLFLFAGINGFLENGLTVKVIECFFGSVFFLIWGFFIKQYIKARLKSKIKRSEKAFLDKTPKGNEDINKREYVFSENGVEVKTAFGTSNLNWGIFTSYAEIKNYVYLMAANDTWLLVDKSGMSDDEVKELYDLLKEKIAN